MTLKQSIERYRTFNGERYVAWLISPSEDRIAAYRAGDVKCRRVDGELFIRLVDEDQAKDIDRAAEGAAKP